MFARILRMAVLSLFCVPAAIGTGQVQVYDWNAAVNGNWHDPNQWAGGTVMAPVPNGPSAEAHITIVDPPTDYQVTLDQDAQVGTLLIDSSRASLLLMGVPGASPADDRMPRTLTVTNDELNPSGLLRISKGTLLLDESDIGGAGSFEIRRDGALLIRNDCNVLLESPVENRGYVSIGTPDSSTSITAGSLFVNGLRNLGRVTVWKNADTKHVGGLSLGGNSAFLNDPSGIFSVLAGTSATSITARTIENRGMMEFSGSTRLLGNLVGRGDFENFGRLQIGGDVAIEIEGGPGAQANRYFFTNHANSQIELAGIIRMSRGVFNYDGGSITSVGEIEFSMGELNLNHNGGGTFSTIDNLVVQGTLSKIAMGQRIYAYANSTNGDPATATLDVRFNGGLTNEGIVSLLSSEIGTARLTTIGVDSKFINAGMLDSGGIEGSTGSAFVGAILDNRGTGKLVAESHLSFVPNDNPTIVHKNEGRIEVRNNKFLTFAKTKFENMAGGVMLINGIVSFENASDPTLVNKGKVSPGNSIGKLVVGNGNLKLEAGGELEIELGLGGPGFGYDSVEVLGDGTATSIATLGGKLRVVTPLNFDPPLGTEFFILSAHQVNGVFAMTQFDALAGTKSLALFYPPGGPGGPEFRHVVLRVVPEPTGAAIVLLMTIGVGRMRKSSIRKIHRPDQARASGFGSSPP